MIVKELIKILAEFNPHVQVKVSLDWADYIVKGYTTYGGEDPHTVLLIADSNVKLMLVTEEEAEFIESMRGREVMGVDSIEETNDEPD